jgi:hypothetical protein
VFITAAKDTITGGRNIYPHELEANPVAAVWACVQGGLRFSSNTWMAQ